MIEHSQTTPPRFPAREWHTVPGRGRIAIVDLGAPDIAGPAVGTSVEIDGLPYRVRGVERSRTLTDPPRLDPIIGILVGDVR